MKRILLHTCCAPCTTATHEWLNQNNFDVTGFFFNPNIHPLEEFNKRKETMSEYSLKKDLPVIYSNCYMEEEYKARGKKDCTFCYELRLGKTAEMAKAEGFDSFSTTLLVSPYQEHGNLKKVGEKLSKKQGIEFIYHDFRKLYRRSRELSRETNLYRQKYCGCIWSLL